MIRDAGDVWGLIYRGGREGRERKWGGRGLLVVGIMISYNSKHMAPMEGCVAGVP